MRRFCAAAILVVFAAVLVGGTGCPWRGRFNTLRLVNGSADFITEMRVVYTGDPVWSGNWLPNDLAPGETRDFGGIEDAHLNVLIVVDRPAPEDEYTFTNVPFAGGQTYVFTVTSDDVVLDVFP